MRAKTTCNTYKFILLSTVLLWLLLLAICCNEVNSTPMLYKKNTEDKYEADLVPVSSTVIPLTVLEVSYGLGGKPSEEYKMAYLRKLRKKVKHAGQDAFEKDPDTLITIKTKQQDATKAKVKGIIPN